MLYKERLPILPQYKKMAKLIYMAKILMKYRKLHRQRRAYKRVAKAGLVINKLSRSLQTSQHVVAPLDIANKLCVICYCLLTDTTFDGEHQVEETECHHYFHKHCLTTWNVISKTCPVCRKTIA